MANKRSSRQDSKKNATSSESTGRRSRRAQSSAKQTPRQLPLKDGIDGIQEDDRRQATHSVFNWRYFFTQTVIGRMIVVVFSVALLLLAAILLSKNQMEAFFMWVGVFLLIGIVVRIILFYKKYKGDEKSDSNLKSS